MTVPLTTQVFLRQLGRALKSFEFLKKSQMKCAAESPNESEILAATGAAVSFQYAEERLRSVIDLLTDEEKRIAMEGPQ